MAERQINLCGSNISKIRNKANPPITQESLIAKLQSSGFDIDRATLAKIETKKRKVYDYEVVIFAKVLGVKLEALLSNDK